MELARQALGAALRVRQRAGIGIASPLCPFDLSERHGIEVRFVDIPSMEAMYCKLLVPTILINANRPPGRQRFNCAHEFGHHQFGHGLRVDEIGLGEENRPRAAADEFLATSFAGFLLMPKSAVEHALAVRGWRASTCTPAQLYVIAGVLGVSYEAIVTHLQVVLKRITAAQAKALHRHTPQAIRASLVGRAIDTHLVVVDPHWSGRAIDVRTGDLILAPAGAVSADDRLVVEDQLASGVLLRAVMPGLVNLVLADGSWSAFVRIMRAGYVGRAVFRHLAEIDDD